MEDLDPLGARHLQQHLGCGYAVGVSTTLGILKAERNIAVFHVAVVCDDVKATAYTALVGSVVNGPDNWQHIWNGGAAVGLVNGHAGIIA